MKTLLVSIIVSASFVACTPPVPQFDLANAKKEIEAANQALSNYISKGDSVGLASAYSKEGAIMINNMPSVKGKENIMKVWGGFINAGVGHMSITTIEIWGNDDYITEEGLVTFETKNGTLIDKGKYLVLWKKEDGKWKLHRDIANSDLPSATK